MEEIELMKEILEAKSALEIAEQPVTPGSIRKLLGIESSFLKHSEQVNNLLRNLEKLEVERRYQLHEEELLVQAETVIQELKSKQQPITQMNITKRMGSNPSTLRRYPRVLALIGAHVKKERQQKFLVYHQQKEEKIKKDVLDAVRHLRALNQRITIKAICEIVQVSRHVIIRYPLVNEVLDSLVKRRQNAILRRYS